MIKRVQNNGMRLKKIRPLAYSDFRLCSLFLWVISRQFSPMRETTEFQVKKEVLIKIGDRVLIDDQEWKVAEIISDTVVLYRESISGKSQTIQEPVEVIKSHLQEQKNQDI